MLRIAFHAASSSKIMGCISQVIVWALNADDILPALRRDLFYSSRSSSWLIIAQKPNICCKTAQCWLHSLTSILHTYTNIMCKKIFFYVVHWVLSVGDYWQAFHWELHKADPNIFVCGLWKLLIIAHDCWYQLFISNQPREQLTISLNFREQLSIALDPCEQLTIAHNSCKQFTIAHNSCKQLTIAIDSWRQLTIAHNWFKLLTIAIDSWEQFTITSKYWE